MSSSESNDGSNKSFLLGLISSTREKVSEVSGLANENRALLCRSFSENYGQPAQKATNCKVLVHIVFISLFSLVNALYQNPLQSPGGMILDPFILQFLSLLSSYSHHHRLVVQVLALCGVGTVENVQEL